MHAMKVNVCFLTFLLVFTASSFPIDDLITLIRNDDTQGALKEIRGSVQLASKEKFGISALHMAAYKGNYILCKEILFLDPKLINKFALDGSTSLPLRRTPLLYALHGLHELNHQPTLPQSQEKEKMYQETVRFLISKGAKVTQRDEHGRNALHLTLQFGLTSLVSETAGKSCTATAGVSAPSNDMLQKTHQNYKGWNVFHFAVYTRYRSKMISNLLLKEGASSLPLLQSYFAQAWNPIFSDLFSPSLGHNEVKREEIWEIVSKHSDRLLAVLVDSCSSSSWNITSLLQSTNEVGYTAFHQSIDAGDAKTLSSLISLFPDVWKVVKVEASLMHLASARGFDDCVDVLLDHDMPCRLDDMSRLPSDVWHMKTKIPERLVAWESIYCLHPLDVDAGTLDDSKDGNHVHEECSIAVIDAAEMNAEEFQNSFLSLRKPVLVRGAVSHWKALTSWNTQYFTRRFGSLEVWMGTIPYAPQFNLPGKKGSLNDYAKYLSILQSQRELVQDKPIMYVFDNDILSSREGKDLLRDIEIPSFVADYPWSVAQFMWGPEGSGAPLHHHQDAWNGLVFGEKKWWFFPPNSATSSTHISSHWDTPYFCTQRPGDFVYVPDSWSHAIYNTKLTAAVAIEFSYP